MPSRTLHLSHGSAEPAANSLAPGQEKPLTPCQLEIVRLIVDAKTNAEIAEILNRSPHTVKKHVENLLNSLGVPNRAGAVSWWHEHGKKWSQAPLDS
jgi:DNA-binding CsgD family transcriptional regulator